MKKEELILAILIFPQVFSDTTSAPILNAIGKSFAEPVI
jgi:hypothetical protein